MGYMGKDQHGLQDSEALQRQREHRLTKVKQVKLDALTCGVYKGTSRRVD